MKPECSLRLLTLGVSGVEDNSAEPHLRRRLGNPGIVPRDNTVKSTILGASSQKWDRVPGIQVEVRLWSVQVKNNHKTKILHLLLSYLWSVP